MCTEEVQDKFKILEVGYEMILIAEVVMGMIKEVV